MADSSEGNENALPIQLTALPLILEVLGEPGSGLTPNQLEAVRHLPSISEGPRYSVRRHIRAQALGRRVAAKILNRSISPGAEERNACSPSELARFLKEIKLLNYAPFLRHENIVDLDAVEFGIFSGNPLEICPVLVFKEAELGSLDVFQTAPNSQSLPWSLRTSLCFDIASGLQVLHDHGVLHGNLNPSHILLCQHPQRGLLAKLTGFGEAQIISNLKSFPALLGTAPWRAPEVEEASVCLDNVLKTDIFSLGLVLWSVCVMQNPFAIFDLPFDPTASEESIKFILRQPYVFRCIPFFIQHKVRNNDAEALKMLEELFECSVRLSPKHRDLSNILHILQPHSGRPIESVGQEESGDAFKQPYIDIEGAILTGVTTGVSVLKELPFLVAKEYFKTLQLILDLPLTENTNELVSGSCWTLFLCYFYGYGTERNIPAAIHTLRDRLSTPKGPSALVQNTTSVLSRALRDEFPVDVAIDALDISLEETEIGNFGPWKTLRQPPPVHLPHHGLEVDGEEILSLLHRVRVEEDILEKDIGGGNTLLHTAALLGLADHVLFLGELSRVDINAQNARGETPLYLSCVYGHVKAAETLLDLGANAAINTHGNENGLHWLCSFPQETIRDLALDLFEFGADLNLPSAADLRKMEWESICPPEVNFLQEGKIAGNPLLTAIANRDMDSLPVILRLAQDFTLMCSPETQLFVALDLVFVPALRLACELHLFQIIVVLSLALKDSLLSLKQDSLPPPVIGLFQQLSDGVCLVGEVFTTLTKSTSHLRAALDMRYHLHRLAYHEAEWQFACRQSIEVLIDHGFVTNVVKTERGLLVTPAFAIQCGNNEALRTLLKLTMSRAGQVDVADGQGFTLVHHALNSGRLDSLKILAEHGAELDLRKHRDPNHCLTGAGASYLHVLGSLRLEDPAFVHIFLDHGVPATIVDNQGTSALALALIRGAFMVARVLLQNGASLLDKGRFGLTRLGEIFLPGMIDQHDDVFSTIKFILSYEDGDTSLFITSPELGYSVLHTVARCYSTNKFYRQLVEMLIQKYGKNEYLEARANNPAKSTALFTAVAQLNPVVVEALVGAGADMDDTDSNGRTPLQYAREVHAKLIYNLHSVSDGDKLEDLERIVSVITVLVEKGGQLEHVDIPRINVALDQAEPLLKRMMSSEHKVAYMRHLEDTVMATVHSGYSNMIGSLDIDGLDLIRRVVQRRVKPCLRVDLEYRILPLSSNDSTPFEYEAVRERIPWCGYLTNRDLQQFQQAAAFEWLQDLIQSDSIPRSLSELGAAGISEYAMTRNPASLPYDPKIVRYPNGLLEWYEAIFATNSLLGEESDWEQRLIFLDVLRKRKVAREQGIFPLPAFDESFREFHFNKLQPQKLELESSVASISIILRCRCYYEEIGTCSRFQLMRMTQRMTSIETNTWKDRLNKYTEDLAGFENNLSKWKQLATGLKKDSQHISILSQLLSDAGTPESALLLAHPKDLNDMAPESESAYPQPPVSSNEMEEVVFKPNYRPLDMEKLELRFLRLSPPSSTGVDVSQELVECSLEQFSISPDFHTEEYRDFNGRPGIGSSTPMQHHRDWIKASENHRFVWGDFDCLSYTWGSPKPSKRILLDGKPVTVGANLEAALRSLRNREEHRNGLLLWVDAICINQDDLDEKAKLVNEMYHFYRAARTITVWLGAEDRKTVQSVNSLRDFVSTYTKMSDPKDDSQEGELLECPAIWYSTNIVPALVYLFDRPYWKRLWVMQEITASAICERFYIGDHFISWTEILLLIRHHRKLRSLYSVTDEFGEAQLSRTSDNLAHTQMLTAMAEIYRNSPGIGNRNLSLEFGSWSNWIHLGGTAKVTDERDRVYGLLGLLNSKITCRVRVRYSVPAAIVFRDFSRALVEASESFDDVLAGNEWNEPDGCSWAINLSNKVSRRVTKANAAGERKRKIPQVAIELDESDRSPGQSLNSTPEVRFNFSEDGTMLSMWCVQVDTVEGISGNARSSQARMEWKQPLQTLHPEQHSTDRESLLRIMYGDMERSDELNATLLDIPWYGDVEPDAPMIEQLQNNGWWDIIQMENFRAFHGFRRQKGDFILYNKRPFSSFFPDTVVPCVSKEKIAAALGPIVPVVDSTFITTTSGRVGSTSVNTQVGDGIFIIPGCSYPVLMRLENGHHKVVGECYVDGLMRGEGLEGRLEDFEEIHCL